MSIVQKISRITLLALICFSLAFLVSLITPPTASADEENIPEEEIITADFHYVFQMPKLFVRDDSYDATHPLQLAVAPRLNNGEIPNGYIIGDIFTCSIPVYHSEDGNYSLDSKPDNYGEDHECIATFKPTFVIGEHSFIAVPDEYQSMIESMTPAQKEAITQGLLEADAAFLSDPDYVGWKEMYEACGINLEYFGHRPEGSLSGLEIANEIIPSAPGMYYIDGMGGDWSSLLGYGVLRNYIFDFKEFCVFSSDITPVPHINGRLAFTYHMNGIQQRDGGDGYRFYYYVFNSKTAECYYASNMSMIPVVDQQGEISVDVQMPDALKEHSWEDLRLGIRVVTGANPMGFPHELVAEYADGITVDTRDVPLSQIATYNDIIIDDALTIDLQDVSPQISATGDTTVIVLTILGLSSFFAALFISNRRRK